MIAGGGAFLAAAAERRGALLAPPRRFAPSDSPDFFVTPPWAARALLECLPLCAQGEPITRRVWEPAAGRGHIARVFAAAGWQVWASDLHDYEGKVFEPILPGVDFTAAEGCDLVSGMLSGTKFSEFLGGWLSPYRDEGEGAPPDEAQKFAGWIVTNPPFGRLWTPFARTALYVRRELHCEGVALFGRVQCLEGAERYRCLFADNPPTEIFVFSERVKTGAYVSRSWKSQSAYAWFVWSWGGRPTRVVWIPPGTEARLTEAADEEGEEVSDERG